MAIISEAICERCSAPHRGFNPVAAANACAAQVDPEFFAVGTILNFRPRAEPRIVHVQDHTLIRFAGKHAWQYTLLVVGSDETFQVNSVDLAQRISVGDVRVENAPATVAL